MTPRAEALSIHLSDDVRSKVDEIARSSDRSPARVVEDAVAAYVREKSLVDREIEDAIAGAERGVGHSSASVLGWLDDRAAGDRRPAPKPDLRGRDPNR